MLSGIFLLTFLNSSLIFAGDSPKKKPKIVAVISFPEAIECIVQPYYRHRPDGKPGREITINFLGRKFSGKGTIEIPLGTSATIAIPKAGMKILEVKINKNSVPISKQEDDFVYFENIQNGKHILSVKYEGKPTAAEVEKLVYTYTNNVAQDSLTSGNWIGKYGKNGYLLCDFDGKNLHRTKLPDFLEKIEVKCAENFRDWGTGITAVNASDNRAIYSDIEAEQKRSIGVLNAITTTVEISCKTQKEYKLSLYFTDWKSENLSSIIEVFDLNTKKILMPNYYFNNYQQGKYITLSLNQSVRIRIQRVRGENTSLGGIFFD